MAEVGSPLDARRFSTLSKAYASGGGLVCGDDLAWRLGDRGSGDVASLARLIAAGGVFGFHWMGDFWLPLFQFDPSDLSVRPGVQAVVGDLARVFDGWAMALWFVHPNCWLHGQRPVDLVESRLSAVHEAARGDHTVAGG